MGRLSTKLVRQYELTRPTDQIVGGFFSSLLAGAEQEAFGNAKSLGKVPTLKRTMMGETCKWCAARAGTWTNPTGDLFARHDNCDCKIVVSGYNSRNGELKNYSKADKRYRKPSRGGNGVSGGNGSGGGGKGPALSDSGGRLNLSDKEAMEKIGVTQEYWDGMMNTGEKFFAKTYPGDIRWIKRDQYSGERMLATNDYVDLDSNLEYELKTSNSLKYHTIKESIKAAIEKNPDIKTRFMISCEKRMPDKVKHKLVNYATNRDVIKELRIFDADGEEILLSR